MKRLLVALTAMVAVLAPTTLLTAAPAQAHSVPCVSKAEFRKVVKGMSMRRVHRIFDVRGRQTYFSSASKWYPAEQWREYKACTHWWRGGPHGSTEVDYKRRNGVWRVSSKSAFW